MKLGYIILGGFLSLVLLIVIICGASYVSAYNYGNMAEKELQATYKNNENILAQYGQKVVEASQVTDMYAGDLNKMAQGLMTGRYGESGSKAGMQWIREQMPNLDPSLYTKIQQIIEAGRDKFEHNQSLLIDKKRAYETSLGTLWRGMWMRVAGYPKIDLDDIKVITTTRAKGVFEKGIEEETIKLR